MGTSKIQPHGSELFEKQNRIKNKTPVISEDVERQLLP
jgi:hypothetical protein